MKKIQWGGFGVIVVLVVIGILSIPQARAESIQVSSGEAVTIPAENVSKVAIADPSIADVVPLSEKELSIIGKKGGVTTLTLVKSDGSATVSYRIEVGYEQAAATIREAVGQPAGEPGGIRVRNIGDTVVLDGYVENELQVQRAGQFALAYKDKDKVVNLIEARKPRQVKIRTRIAEVNTDALKNVGLQWFGAGGQVRYTMDYTGGGSIIHGFAQPQTAGGPAVTQPDTLDIGLEVLLDLLITKNYARLLSEPTLITLSGKEASFLVGQEVPIVQQLPQSFTVEFKEVGVRMNIKPIVDSQNQINTFVHAEVSQVIGVGAFGIPIIGSKKADTTLQLRDGQTMVIAGLLENNVERDVLRKVPWLADIPLFGYLFRNKNFKQAQREVMFFTTPEIVKDDEVPTPVTPLMKSWEKEAGKNFLEKTPHDELWPKTSEKSEKKAPSAKPAATKKPAAATKKPAAAAKPASAATPASPMVVSPPVAAPPPETPAASESAPAGPTEEPTTNFSPASPTVE